MERGDLVPDDVMVGLIAERIDQKEAEDGFILDGFPRTEPQAEALESKLNELGRQVSSALLFEVSDEEVVRRLGGRRTCTNGHIFHVDLRPPRTTESATCAARRSRSATTTIQRSSATGSTSTTPRPSR